MAEAADGYRTLDGWLAQLELSSRVERRELAPDLVEAILRGDPVGGPTLDEITRAVAEKFGPEASRPERLGSPGRRRRGPAPGDATWPGRHRLSFRAIGDSFPAGTQRPSATPAPRAHRQTGYARQPRPPRLIGSGWRGRWRSPKGLGTEGLRKPGRVGWVSGLRAEDPPLILVGRWSLRCSAPPYMSVPRVLSPQSPRLAGQPAEQSRSKKD